MQKLDRPKFAKNSAEVEASNGEITFIAARSVKNLNGWTYDVKSLQAQDATGEYHQLTNTAQEVSIPLMTDHSGSIKNKVGTIDSAKIVTVDGIDHVEMHANFHASEEAQEVRQRILDNELTDVSITTDWGGGYDEEDDVGLLKNAHIIEVSVVYAGAEPKAKILAKNSVATTEEENKEENKDETQLTDEQLETIANKIVEKIKVDVSKNDTKEENINTDDKSEEEDEEMANQATNGTAEKVADKNLVLNTLTELAKNGSIQGLNRSQVKEAVKNAISLKDGSEDYVVPDAVFTEILAATRPTDILDTFNTLPIKRLTLMGEERSEQDVARAGKYTKGEQKQIQALTLQAQKFATQFIYKLQELDYEDMQEDFGNLLYTFIRQELPQKVSEEEERAFIVGDGRSPSSKRKITSIVSLDAAATDNSNIHVYNYNGSGDLSPMAAILAGTSKLGTEGATYAVMNKVTLASLRSAGLDTANGLPFSVETVAGAMGVSKIFTREYVATGVIYVYTGSLVKRLVGGSNGETIEQYDIDYNKRKIEFIRPSGGGATELYSAVKITIPEVESV